MTDPLSPLQVVIVSGLSGSGKSVALHALEDAGFFCVDNLPSALVIDFVRLCEHNQAVRRVAVALDVRERWFARDRDESHAQLLNVLEALSARGASKDGAGQASSILFLVCDEEILVNRFKTTRRPHPLVAHDVAASLGEAIALEREWLMPFRERASLVIDTSGLTVHDLRRRVTTLYGERASQPLALHLLSFGFRHGVPAEADFVFDVRFLDNPFFVKELRDQTGLDPTVARFVTSQPLATRLLDHIDGLVADVLPAITAEGRASLTLAIGCTGGHHRSVALTQALALRLTARGSTPHIVHRDIAR